jgi:sec-independent protein translocase protein TatB
MFEFDAGKLIIIGIVALIVIGPKELPRVMRQIGQVVSKMRRMATEFQSQFMDAMKESEVAEIRAEAAKLAEQAKLDVAFNPVADVKASLTEALNEPKAGEQKAIAAPPHEDKPSVATDSETAGKALQPEGETSGDVTTPSAQEQTSETSATPSSHPTEHAAAQSSEHSETDKAKPEPLPLRTSA